MTAPLSHDLRERIVQAVAGGSTIRQAARRFAVSASAAIKLMQRVRQTGSLAPSWAGKSARAVRSCTESEDLISGCWGRERWS